MILLGRFSTGAATTLKLENLSGTNLNLWLDIHQQLIARQF
jgi:hypothetical protein